MTRSRPCKRLRGERLKTGRRTLLPMPPLREVRPSARGRFRAPGALNRRVTVNLYTHLFRRRDDSAELAAVGSQFGKRFRTAAEDSTRRRCLVSAPAVFSKARYLSHPLPSRGLLVAAGGIARHASDSLDRRRETLSNASACPFLAAMNSSRSSRERALTGAACGSTRARRTALASLFAGNGQHRIGTTRSERCHEPGDRSVRKVEQRGKRLQRPATLRKGKRQQLDRSAETDGRTQTIHHPSFESRPRANARRRD